jgi:hypothetical protein
MKLSDNTIRLGFTAITTAVTLLIIFVGASILFNTWETFEVEWKAIGWMFAGVGALLTPVFLATAIYEVLKLKYKNNEKTDNN